MNLKIHWNLKLLFVLSCVILAEQDYVEADTATNDCEPLAPSISAKKTDRKAWNKCIEYQENLVYPCEHSTSLSGGQSLSRANHCQIKKTNNNLTSIPVPHMVILGFGEPLSRVGWLCGATLLSEKYILAPANCKDLFGDIAVSYAKIGTQNNFNDIRDGVHKIKSVITHPEYKVDMKYDDIALFELDIPVNLSPNVVPACLPINDVKDDEALCSYWDAKKVFQTNVRSKASFENCSKKFQPASDLEYGINSTTQVCYEDKTYLKTDNCVDTLGGPLQVMNTDIDCMYTVIGIAAFGVNSCSHEMYAFTKVAPYVPWIESVVWPDADIKTGNSVTGIQSDIKTGNSGTGIQSHIKTGNSGISVQQNLNIMILIVTTTISIFLLTVI